MSVRVDRLEQAGADGAVTVVTLDRPEVRNAVDGEHARALPEAVANEWRHGGYALQSETVAGAQRFAAGEGRHGAFD